MSNRLRFIVMMAVLLFGVYLMIFGSFGLGVFLHVVVVLPLLWGTLHPNSRLFGPVQSHTQSDELWLTIDDGPDPVDTPNLLKLLDEYNVKATFFVIGEKAERYPELIREIHDAGHGIGNHSWSHAQAWFWCHGPWRTKLEIERCQECVESITEVAPSLFRAPVGHSNIFVHRVLRHLDIRLIGWSSRGYDAVATDAGEVSQRICESMQPGAIVLVHEATPIAEEVVQTILDHAVQQGFKFGTVRK